MDDVKHDGTVEPVSDSAGYGYKKPPRDKQFQKGKSGNPSGRPKPDKRHKSVSRVLRDCLLEEVKVTVNGRQRTMTRLEAVVAKQTSNALQGNVQSARFLLGLAEKHVPNHLSLTDLMEGHSVFEFTKEEAARFTYEKLIEGMALPDEKPVL